MELSYVRGMTAPEIVTKNTASDPDLTAADVTWNLETLLDGAETADQLLDQAEAVANELEPYRGTVATLDAESLAVLMTKVARISELMSRAGHYGGLRFAENTQDAEVAAMMQRLDERSTAIGSKVGVHRTRVCRRRR